MMRSISIEELAGFREALLDCVFVSIYPPNTIDCVELVVTERYFQHIDPCFFVAAGAGIKVAKAR
jgi:anthranilate phosphoribosyltransferase